MYAECWYDGSCEPVNPHGHTSFGALVKVDGVEVLAQSGYVGVGALMSNNVGEYAGIIAVMKFLLRESLTEGIIHGDSKLVTKQMNGQWKAKRGLYLPYYSQAILLRTQLPKVCIEWIPREKNGHADWLARLAIKGVLRSDSRDEHLRHLIQEQREDNQRTRRIQLVKRKV